MPVLCGMKFFILCVQRTSCHRAQASQKNRLARAGGQGQGLRAGRGAVGGGCAKKVTGVIFDFVCCEHASGLHCPPARISYVLYFCVMGFFVYD